ncbi:MAG TPA: sulfotransferase [Streptosporangiaceae bacterium]|jgi:hypothetical protein
MPAGTGPDPAAAAAQSGPVIVAAFRFSGVQALQSVLSGYPGLTCTTGSGIIAACATAMSAWQQVEQARTPSQLAASSVRALASSMITRILAADGGTRWCDVVSASADAMAVFARLYPRARFICLHRACDKTVAAATAVSRWGLGSTGVAEFAAAYPGNSVAAVAAYWRASTSGLLDFEQAHQDRTLRLRHEDLAASPEQAAAGIAGFLGLPACQPGGPVPPPDAAPDGQDRAAQPVPLQLIPAPMLTLVNELHARLGYPALAPGQDALSG